MTDLKTLAHESFRLIESGDEQLAARIVAPDFINHEAADDPDEVQRQQRGPAGFLATGSWLRAAFSELHFECKETAADADLVMAAGTMTGRHTGVFQGIEPTGRRIAQEQVHIFTTAGGHLTSHRAVRDDLGVLLQLD
jgi:predicted ester cyclase